MTKHNTSGRFLKERNANLRSPKEHGGPRKTCLGEVEEIMRRKNNSEVHRKVEMDTRKRLGLGSQGTNGLIVVRLVLLVPPPVGPHLPPTARGAGGFGEQVKLHLWMNVYMNEDVEKVSKKGPKTI
jgi:hypothetical protein